MQHGPSGHCVKRAAGRRPRAGWNEDVSRRETSEPANQRCRAATSLPWRHNDDRLDRRLRERAFVNLYPSTGNPDNAEALSRRASVLDTSVLAEIGAMSPSNPGFVRELIAIFLEEAPARIDTLRDAIAVRDPVATWRAATRASRRKRVRNSASASASAASESGRILIATSRPRRGSIARQTSPIPPAQLRKQFVLPDLHAGKSRGRRVKEGFYRLIRRSADRKSTRLNSSHEW